MLEKITPYIGWAGFLFGLVTAIAAPLPGWGAPVSLIAMFPGFLLSSLYILFSSRYKIKSGWVNPGYTGIFLSSVPIMMIIYFQFIK